MYLDDAPVAARPHLPVTTLMSVPDGVAGTRATLDIMTKLAKTGRASPLVRVVAAELTQGLPQKDWRAEMSAVHSFVQNQIRYVRDPVKIERIQTADVTLRVRSGDCDDKSVLTAALLESIGHPARFVAIGAHPGVYSHVYVEANLRRGKSSVWIPIETTEPWGFGRGPAKFASRMVRDV